MMSQNSDLLSYSVDRMIVRNGRIFGFGWIFHRDAEIESIQLELRLSDGGIVTLPVIYNKLRDDVYKEYPNSPHSLRCGFVVYGGWNDSADIADVSLVGSLQEGEAFKVAASITNLSLYSRLSSIKTLPYRVLLARAWNLLLSGKFKALHYKIKRYWPAMSASNDNIFTEISKLQPDTSCRRFILVVDHDLGGGANTYREGLVKEYLLEGHGILLLTYNLLSLQYVVDVCTSEGRKRFSVSGLDILVKLAEEGLIHEVFYNNAVSFERPEDIPDLLVALRQIYGLPLTIAVHDFFTICPSHFLLNSDGRYCGIPSLDQCASCLQHVDYGFVSLYESKSIELWRKKWGSCYKLADRILCFSNTSRHLIQKSYPTIASEQIEVIPHAVKYRPVRKPEISFAHKLNIGVVGEIGFHKGSQVVQALAREIVREELNVSISVIGLIEIECDGKVVTETGPYEHSQLVELIEARGPNVFFFPSIWPETFSYVTDELMQLDVPIVCFDLGAPAERVRKYARGKVIPIADAGTNLREICEFYEDLARSVGNGK
jgi:glycosyltransferase involved in cell wall biosynthesis